MQNQDPNRSTAEATGLNSKVDESTPYQKAQPESKRWWPGEPVQDLSLAAILAKPTTNIVGRSDLQLDTIPAGGGQHNYKPVLVTSGSEFNEVVELRREVYGRHARVLDIKLEPFDTAPDTAVLGIRDLDGELFATMRVCFSFAAKSTWSHKVDLPAPYNGSRLAFFERLSIRGGGLRAARAKQQLFKIAYLLSLARECQWIIISALPPLNRHFESLGFINIFGPHRMVTVDWYPDPFFIMSSDLRDRGNTLLRANRTWYDHIVTPDPELQSLIGKYFHLQQSPKAEGSTSPSKAMDASEISVQRPRPNKTTSTSRLGAAPDSSEGEQGHSASAT